MDASIIIPTHNRREWVLQAVHALLRQDHPAASYEVIVSCDRCTDGTMDALQTIADRRLRVISALVAGTSGALNTGLRVARGRLAIFLDDEEEVDSNFVSAHVQAHQASSAGKLAVVGYSRVVVHADAVALTRELAKQYEQFFAELDLRRETGGRSTPLDLCGSNFSIPVHALLEIGGFNEALFFQRNDFELAVRLLERGYQFSFCRAASAKMSIALDRADIVGRAADRARNDCALARAYPSCIPHLPFYRNVRDPRRRWRPWVWWGAGGIGRGLLTVAATLAPSSLRIMHWDYAARYYAELREEIGSWSELRGMCVASSARIGTCDSHEERQSNR